MALVLCIPDLHAPYHHPGALDFVAGLADKHKPDEIVFLGDEADCTAWSTHPKDPHLPGPSDELEQAAEALKPFYARFPRAKVCVSNHCIRPAKRAAEAGLPDAMVQLWAKAIRSPRGWRWRDEWVVDGVSYRHGDGFSGQHAMRAAAERMRRSVVFGHLHSLSGAVYLTGPHDEIFGAAMGCLIDPTSRAFSYARYDVRKPVLSAGLVEDGRSVNVIRMPKG